MFKSHNRLARRFFWVILMIITVLFLAIYLYSVPLIKSQVYEIERNSANLALNNVFQLANKMYSNLEGFRQQTLSAHKQRLKAVVELAEAQITSSFRYANIHKRPIAEVRRQLFSELSRFKYGQDGYIWIVDHDANLLAHPDSRYQGLKISELGNKTEQAIIQEIIDTAINKGEGYFKYKWQRLDQGPAVDKLSYVKNFPQWGFIIGSGLYLDDLEAEVKIRKQQAITEVRDALKEIHIAKTGYLYIFDKSGHLLAHPNPNIDQTNAINLIDPVTGHSIIEELISVADTGKELHYKWDKPDDPGNYIYDKISLVRSLDGFGWYICSSVYVDELKQSSVVLTQRILSIALIAIFVAITLAYVFLNLIFQPIRQLAKTAASVKAGDLTARSGIINRDDELGLLAQTFDAMIQRLHSNIINLDQEVQERSQELAIHEERQHLILDALPAQIAYLNSSLQYIFVNRSYAEIFGGDKQTIIGRHISEVVGKEMMSSITPMIERALQGEEVAYEYRFCLSGKDVITKRMLIPDYSTNGKIIGLLNLSLDITAEKEAEKRLTEAQRLSATGQLAGGLAHDFNNILSVVLGNLLAADEHFHSTNGLDNYLKPAIRASRRGAEITARLLTFSRRQTLSPSIIDLNSMIKEITSLISNSFPSNITISHCIKTKKSIYADESLLENALVNLALNAKDALENGGQIEFLVINKRITKATHYDEPVQPGEYIEIQVNDNGTGFTEDALLQACEPFYTTKASGKGSGLGLSMVYGFIKQSSGYLSIQNRTTGGASISLLLPISHQTLPDKSLLSVDPVQAHRATGELLLLAEDDRDVRNVIRDQLTDLGYMVIEASNSDEADALLHNIPDIAGLISDIDMPGHYNGFELAERMKNQYPHSTILLISGNILALQTQDIKEQWAVLRKPFDKTQLAHALLQAKSKE